MVEVLKIGHCDGTVDVHRRVWPAMFFSLTGSILYMSHTLVVMKDIEESISYGPSLVFCILIFSTSSYQKSPCEIPLQETRREKPS